MQWKKGVLFLIMYSLMAVNTAPAQQLGFKIKNNDRKVKIPFELHNNLIVIPVILNNKLPLKFVLDTGVRTAILVEKDFSDLLNLSYSRHYVLSGVGIENSVNAYITNNVSLTIPGIHGEGHALLVLEKDLLELKNYLGTTVHGILGYELFSRFIIDINYATRVLTISEPEDFRPSQKYEVVPMFIEDTKPYIYAKLHQSDSSEVVVKLMVDSGASQSLFIEYQSDSNKLKLPKKTLYSTIGRGLGGPIKGYVGRLEGFEIGKYLMEDIIVNYPESSNYIDSLKYVKTDRDGTIGGEMLSRFNIIFDFPNEKFYFKKNADYKKDFTYNLSGLTVRAIGPQLKTYEIAEVRVNSAGAEAGLQVGDTIVSINNHPAENLLLSNIIGILNSSPDRKIRMVVKRQKALLSFEFRLKSLI